MQKPGKKQQREEKSMISSSSPLLYWKIHPLCKILALEQIHWWLLKNDFATFISLGCQKERQIRNFFFSQTYQVAVAIFPAREAHHRQSRQRQLQSNTQHFIYIYHRVSGLSPIAIAIYLAETLRLRFPRKRPQHPRRLRGAIFFYISFLHAAKSCVGFEKRAGARALGCYMGGQQQKGRRWRTTMGICAQVYSDQMEISLHCGTERKMTIMALNRCFSVACEKRKPCNPKQWFLRLIFSHLHISNAILVRAEDIINY